VKPSSWTTAAGLPRRQYPTRLDRPADLSRVPGSVLRDSDPVVMAHAPPRPLAEPAFHRGLLRRQYLPCRPGPGTPTYVPGHAAPDALDLTPPFAVLLPWGACPLSNSSPRRPDAPRARASVGGAWAPRPHPASLAWRRDLAPDRRTFAPESGRRGGWTSLQQCCCDTVDRSAPSHDADVPPPGPVRRVAPGLPGRRPGQPVGGRNRGSVPARSSTCTGGRGRVPVRWR